MRVLFVTSEARPLAKSGGLADVSSALPSALLQQGMDVRVLLPAYPGAKAVLHSVREVQLPELMGLQQTRLLSGRVPGSPVPIWLLDAPLLFERPGGPYQDENGCEWPDNAERFAFLAHAAAHIATGRIPDWKPDIVHANDWHTGLLPLLLSMEPGPTPPTIFTIHNLAFQGNFPKDSLQRIGVPERLFDAGDVEFYGQMSFMKAAIRYSDQITTVSPRYAEEILTPEFGCGMEGILQERSQSLFGILNGIDTEEWNPSSDEYLPCTYGLKDLSGKQVCKSNMQKELGLEEDPCRPLIAFASRLTHQKMADVVVEAIPSLIAAGAQFALVGEGDPALEAALAEFAHRYPGQAAIQLEYEERSAHRLQAASDILLAPARFEPCGLTQLYALRYGTLPIVRRTGGLADTITDTTSETLSNRTATGFFFEESNLPALLDAARRALSLYSQPLTWRRLQLQAMSEEFGWDASAAQYAALYRAAAGLSSQPRTDQPNCDECLPSRRALIN